MTQLPEHNEVATVCRQKHRWPKHTHKHSCPHTIRHKFGIISQHKSAN